MKQNKTLAVCGFVSGDVICPVFLLLNLPLKQFNCVAVVIETLPVISNDRLQSTDFCSSDNLGLITVY